MFNTSEDGCSNVEPKQKVGYVFSSYDSFKFRQERL